MIRRTFCSSRLSSSPRCLPRVEQPQSTIVPPSRCAFYPPAWCITSQLQPLCIRYNKKGSRFGLVGPMTLCAVMCAKSFFSSADATVRRLLCCQVMCIECEVHGVTARCTWVSICVALVPLNRRALLNFHAPWATTRATTDTLRSTGSQKLGWMAM